MTGDTLTLRPALGAIVPMAIVSAFFLFVGIGALSEMQGTDEWKSINLASSGALIVFALWAGLLVPTARIHLTPDSLFLRRFWHTRWRVPRARAVLCSGGVGPEGLLPGMAVYDSGTDKKIGEILAAQFHPGDLQHLQRMLTGGCSGTRPVT
ncbi:hypothetical protein [Brevundimonas sp.]|uniref:hypothetical protein n=1 Tax=Brevundimonas sp. TaxID=1871086 RepID=UPI00272FF37D|nr:hypothetical protein [Brevundimonas sp.]MDP1911710.1 hypothetical protein [Brevundimonas sp.]